MSKQMIILTLFIAVIMSCCNRSSALDCSGAVNVVAVKNGVDVVDLSCIKSLLHPRYGQVYEVRRTGDSELWYVDNDYGIIRYWQNLQVFEDCNSLINEQVMLPLEQQVTPLSKEEKIQAQRDYLEQLRPEFSNPTDYHWIKGGYYRLLGQRYYSMLDGALAAVCPANGDILWHEDCYGIPHLISTTPAISAQQGAVMAVQFALQKEGVESAICIEHDSTWLVEDIYRAQSIWHHYWVFDYEEPVESAEELLAIYNSLNWNAGTEISVDGNTGEIRDHGGLLGGSPTKPDVNLAKGSFTNKKGNAHEPPGFIAQPEGAKASLNGRDAGFPSAYWVDGVPYVYVKYVPALSGGPAVAVWQDGQAWVKAAGRLAKIRAGSRIAGLDGKSVDLGGAPINFRGRIYLPLTAFQALAGVDVRYDSKTKTLNIQSEYLPRVEEK